MGKAVYPTSSEEKFGGPAFAAGLAAGDHLRLEGRVQIKKHAVVSLGSGTPFEAEVIDISINGCCMVAAISVGRHHRVSIALSSLCVIEGHVRWSRKRTLGIQFTKPLLERQLISIRNTLNQLG